MPRLSLLAIMISRLTVRTTPASGEGLVIHSSLTLSQLREVSVMLQAWSTLRTLELKLMEFTSGAHRGEWDGPVATAIVAGKTILYPGTVQCHVTSHELGARAWTKVCIIL